MAFAHAGALGGPSEWLGPVTHVLAETVTCVLSPHLGTLEFERGGRRRKDPHMWSPDEETSGGEASEAERAVRKA